MDEVELSENNNFCLLGLLFSKDFSWKAFIESVAKSAAMKVKKNLKKLKNLYAIIAISRENFEELNMNFVILNIW